MKTENYSVMKINFRNLWLGALGGVAGGVPMGLMMGMNGFLPTVGSLIGVANGMAGFIVHMFISVGVGVLYGHFAPIVSQTWKSASIAGVVYGIIWWVLGALIAMPFLLGTPIFFVGIGQWMSLMGHIMYTVIMALVFKALYARGQTLTVSPVPSS